MSEEIKSGHIGVCRCRHCKKTNPWRSDFKYAVAIPGRMIFAPSTAIEPGFLGACRHCGVREPQDVIEITESLEEAVSKSDTVQNHETSTL